MMKSIKYRSAALLLTGIFLLSSVGIPVIIASCPMMKSAKRGACCPIRNTEHKTLLKKYQDYSCCKTVIAAERNTTEFVQNPSELFKDGNGLITLALILPSKLCETNFHTIIFCGTHSPPFSEDISVLTSSFRI
jgi:hypothetical protein